MGCIGTEAYSEMRNALHGRDLTQVAVKEMWKVLEDRYMPKELVVAERDKFLTLRRKPGQSLTDFMSEVMDAAPGCDFDKITDANKAEEMMLTQAFPAEKSIAAKGTPGFYAVRYGRVPGVYGSYRELQENTAGYKFAAFKKFDNEGDAWKFVNGEIPISRDPGQTATFYAVQVGRKPGVFRSWDECLKQIEGNPHAIFKKFTDEKAARDFVKGASTAVNQETRKKV